MKKFIAGLFSLAAALFAVCAITVCAGAETSGDYEYSVLSDGTVEITDYYGSATELEIPPTLGGKKVTSIGDDAFYGSSLKSIIIPDGVTRIGNHSISFCLFLTSITIPDSVKSIGNQAFTLCSSLASVNIPDSVTYIGRAAFASCKSLTSITIPNGMTSINDGVFENCSSITSVIMPDSLKSIGSSTFSGCASISSITIPDSVTSIGFNAFYNCSSLTSINIPNEIRRIDYSSFYGCKSLKDVYYPGSKAQWDKIAIDEDNDELLSATIHYNYGSVPVPSYVSGLKLKARATDALRLTWTKNTSADGYIIEMKDGTKWTRVSKITNNSTVEFKKSKLKAGTAYSFRIRAYKMDGKTALYSGYTSISARTNPSAVSGLKLKGRSGDALRIAWTKNTSADGYIIEMKSGNSWVRVGKVTKNSTVEFRKAGLKVGTAYSFRVKAYKMSGKTALYSGYTTISARTNPSAVSGLKLKNANSNAVRLAWTKNTSADGYIIEIKSGNKWVRVSKITKNSTVEFRKGSLKSKTSYTFRIKAYKMSGKTALYSGYTTITVKTK